MLPLPEGSSLDGLLFGTAPRGSTSSQRRRQRKQRREEWWLRRGIAALNALDGGGERRAVAAHGEPAAVQRQAVRHLAKLYGGVGAPPPDHSSSRSWATLQGAEAGYAPDALADGTAATSRRGAVSLPNLAAGQVRLLDALPGEQQDMLMSGRGLLREADAAAEALEELGGALALDPVLRKGGAEYGLFMEELHDKGATEPSAATKELSGLFFVKRKDSQLRLILDTRRANCHFEPPPPTHLASGEALADIAVPAGRSLRLPSSVDSTGPPVAFQSRVIPMGWNWAVFLVQSAHLHMLKEVGTEHAWVCDKIPSPPLDQGKVLKVLYIDNLAAIALDEGHCDRVLSGMLEAFDRRGVVAHQLEEANRALDERRGLHVEGAEAGLLMVVGSVYVMSVGIMYISMRSSGARMRAALRGKAKPPTAPRAVRALDWRREARGVSSACVLDIGRRRRASRFSSARGWSRKPPRTQLRLADLVAEN